MVKGITNIIHSLTRDMGRLSLFIYHLRRELHATLKEEISLYLNDNPVDGLLETHIMNKSLGS
jgi:hypothetical protein